jgi:predicted nucleic acid-binding protein
VILFKFGKEDVFQKFLDDIMPTVELLSLPADLYKEVVNAKKNMNLDFDDAYQYCIAKHYRLRVATMDSDFKKTSDIEVLFL